jgi:predicted metal-dependent enzyme (double-stranded beta helix superfamily)
VIAAGHGRAIARVPVPCSIIMPYTLERFVADVDRITQNETGPERITAAVAPLLAELIKHPDAIPAQFRRCPADGQRGRYMLHRASRFNVTAVVWRPGDTAGAHNHETWGVIGVIDNEIQETRYRQRNGGGVEVTAVHRHGPGAISCLVPPGDEIHAMHNATERDTVEIHVYGQDLAGLKRRTWGDDGTEKELISPKYLNC